MAAAVIDVSGVEVVTAAPPAAQVSASVTVADLSGVIAEIVADLSGVTVSGVGELVRHIPRLAAHVQALPLAGAEKRDLVLAAGHILVDRCIPEGARATAHGLVDSVFPFAIAAVIDVARGRVNFGNPVEAVRQLAAEGPESVQQAVGGCLPLLAQLCAAK